MAKIKVAIFGAPLKSVFIDPNATAGATVGTDLFMPDGSVATIAALKTALGVTNGAAAATPGAGFAHRLLSGLELGDDHPQYLRKDTLTADGDMYMRASGLVVRLPIGTNHQVLMSTGSAPQWTTLFANPAASIGLAAINGTASTAMRSDAAPALNVGIVPTWTAQHTFNLTPLVGAIKVVLESRSVATGTGLSGGGDLSANRTLSVDDSHFATVALTGAYSDLSGAPTVSQDKFYSRQTPATGFAITVANNVSTLILDPAGVLATGDVTLPAAPVDGHIVRITTSQDITALTMHANAGQTLIPAFSTTLAAGIGISYIYVPAVTSWYRLH